VSPALAPTAVLVHGAWGTPDDWDDVVAGLDERGVASAVADLPTMRSIDATTTDDVDHVRELVLEAGGPVVLCGHSYGGMVITGLGADVPAVHLLYLAAIVPDQGDAMEDLVGGAPAATTRGTEVLPDGSTLMAPWPVPDGPYSPDVLARMAERPRRRFAPGGWWTPVFGATWRHAPSTYVLTTLDERLRPERQRAMAARCRDTVEVEAGHMLPLEAPELVVALLLDRMAGAVADHSGGAAP
jgi:pimeloyl-ACP methyl ester carboxylesterase